MDISFWLDMKYICMNRTEEKRKKKQNTMLCGYIIVVRYEIHLHQKKYRKQKQKHDFTFIFTEE